QDHDVVDLLQVRVQRQRARVYDSAGRSGHYPRAMPKHTLNLHLPQSTIENSDAEIVVYSDAAILGRLLISKGGVDWWPAGRKKSHTGRGGEKFAEVMEAQPRRAAP